MKTEAICSLFGRMPDGTPVVRIVLSHESGIEAAIISYGAAIQQLFVPDGNGRMGNIVLGHDELHHYLAQRDYFGATVGRYANRISAGRFELDGRPYRLSRNDGANSLHGGSDGFDRRSWGLVSYGTDPEPFVVFEVSSPDGDQGFPGELHARVRYSLAPGRKLSVSFEAKADRPTVVNLTHHGFFNLSGPATGNILDHRLTIFADSYLPVSPSLIPLGSPVAVAGTPFDFQTPTAIGTRISMDDVQLERGRGYDHNYCLGVGCEGTPRLAARLYDPLSSRMMEVETDQPGLQFYSGGYLDDSVFINGRTPVGRFGALCLEPQYWPDSPNRKNYPNSVLLPGNVYIHRSSFHFSEI